MRALLPSACLLLLTALSACVGTSDPPKPVAENPNRFTYHMADFTYAVHFPAAADTLDVPVRAVTGRRLRLRLAGADCRIADVVITGTPATFW